MAAAIGGCLLLAAVLVVVSQHRSRLAYENGKLIKTPAVLPGGQRFCQPNEYVPADAEFLRVWVSSSGRPGSPFEVELVRDGRLIARAEHAGGYVDQAVDVPLRTPATETTGVDVCVRNLGSARIGVMGSRAGPNELPARAGTVAQPQVSRRGETSARGSRLLGEPTVVRLEWHLAGRPSWISFAGTLADRAGLVKASFIGSWAMWVALGLVVAAGGGGVLLIVREEQRR